MRRLATSTWLVCVSLATLQLSAAAASDLVWEVENPFRFFKKPSAFALHEKAYDAVRGKPETPVPANIVWRTERRLNDPDCTDKSSPGRCYDTKRAGYERSRLGWAAQTLEVDLLRAQLAAVPLHGGLRAPVFVGHREGRLHPPRCPYGGGDAFARTACGSRHWRMHVLLAAARGCRQGRNNQAAVQEAIRHQAGAVLAGQQGLRRGRQGRDAGRA